MLKYLTCVLLPSSIGCCKKLGKPGIRKLCYQSPVLPYSVANMRIRASIVSESDTKFRVFLIWKLEFEGAEVSLRYQPQHSAAVLMQLQALSRVVTVVP